MAAADAPLLELRQIRKSFPGNTVLRGVEFDLRAGEIHALVGANGAGKSTLLKILAGVYPRDEGEIRIDGAAVPIASAAEALARGIAVIYQEFHLVPERTVAENILLGQEPCHRLAGIPILNRRRIRQEAVRHLERLGFLLDPDQRAGSLPTGKKQLVEIARALYRQARILVLDEPTAALSRTEVEALFRLLRGLRSQGIGMVYVSHHLEELFAVADRVSVLRDGRIAATWPRSELSENAVVQAMLGREVAAGEYARGTAGDHVFELEGGSGAGFREVSLTVRRGEIVTLTGAAGAGQSDVLMAVGGVTPFTAGTLRVRGEARRWRSPKDAAGAGVLLAPGDRKSLGIIPEADVATNLTFPQLRRWSPAGVLNRRAQARAAVEWVRKYSVRCADPHQPIGLLSGGNQQKVVVARAAEREGVLYLLDEPTRGVDRGAREEIYALIHRLASKGAGVLLSSPDIQEALRLGDRTGVFRAGRLVLERETSRLTEEMVLAAILGGQPERESGGG